MCIRDSQKTAPGPPSATAVPTPIIFPCLLYTSFINKKNIVSGYSVSKKTFQFYIGVKHIIIVADDPIHPGAEIQAHLKRAHLPLFCLFQDLFAAEGPVSYTHLDVYKRQLIGCHLGDDTLVRSCLTELIQTLL